VLGNNFGIIEDWIDSISADYFPDHFLNCNSNYLCQGFRSLDEVM
jgi:hypothetical protein